MEFPTNTMRIIGFTLGPNSFMGYTSMLLRPPVSVLSSTVRHILPWFFCQIIPPGREFPESLQAVRMRTESDPFQHLRSRKGRTFDGKGITLERLHQRPEVILVDQEIELTVKQFQLLCPGLFYGTVTYPNLNLLLSERLFFGYVVDPVKLWSIMYDCLCCGSLGDRQRNDDHVKRKLFNSFWASQIYEPHFKLEELEERLESTAERKTLEMSVASMIHKVQAMEEQRYKENVRHYTVLLHAIASKKQQLIAIKTGIVSDIDFETREQCAQQMINILKSELETMLLVSELELNQSRHDLEERIKYEAVLREIHAMICEIQEVFNALNTWPSHAFEVEKMLCVLQNNQSMQMLGTVSNADFKARYISDLKQQQQILSSRISTMHREVEQEKKEISLITSRMQKMKDYIQNNEDDGHGHANSSGANVDNFLKQLQKIMDHFLKASIEASKLEKQILTEEKSAWREYLHIPSIHYDELISIAAAMCAVEELSDVENSFEGFIYERALEANGVHVWVEGVSCAAIFKSRSAADRVIRAMAVDHNVHFLHYNILGRTTRSKTISLLLECVLLQSNELTRGGHSQIGYEELVTKVNTVVKHLKKSFEMKRRLKSVRDARQHLQLEQQKLMNELHCRTQLENKAGDLSIVSNTKYNVLPKLMLNYIYATNKHLKLQARRDSLESFIHQLEGSNLPSDLELLKREELQLTEQFKNTLRGYGLNRQSFYENVRKLIDACESFQSELDRNDEYRWMLQTSPSSECEKLVNHWDAIASALRRTVNEIRETSNETVTSDALTERLNAVEKEIQSLSAQENVLSSKIKVSQQAVTQYTERYPSGDMHSRFTVPRRVPNNISELLGRISEAQRKLQAMPPACKPEEIVRLKNKIKVLKQLEKLQHSFRDMHLNNLILPTIDKLHVQKLQQISTLVADASEDLPELGGTVKVFFSYQDDVGEEINDYDRRMSTRFASFKTSQIAAVNITIQDENGVELETINDYQRHLAFLLLFISFLYAENCKVVIMDLLFQDFFDNGIVGMIDVFKTHFPGMQFIILKNNS